LPVSPSASNDYHCHRHSLYNHLALLDPGHVSPMTFLTKAANVTSPAALLVVLDADSTLIENESIDLLAEAAGVLPQVAAITERAMRGELDFAASLRERVKRLAGLPVEALDAARSRIVVTAGAAALVAAVHAAGGRVGVVSGGFHELLDPVAESLGLDFVRANRLDVRDGVLTGRVTGPIVDSTAKAVALREWARESRTPLSNTIAVGDGANDREMMAVAGLSIAFDAHAIVRLHAHIIIDERDLSQVLAVAGLRG